MKCSIDVFSRCCEKILQIFYKWKSFVCSFKLGYITKLMLYVHKSICKGNIDITYKCHIQNCVKLQVVIINKCLAQDWGELIFLFLRIEDWSDHILQFFLELVLRPFYVLTFMIQHGLWNKGNLQKLNVN